MNNPAHAAGRHHTEADGHKYETTTNPVKRSWQWLVGKVGKVGAIVTLIVVGVAIAAIAAIILRAEVTGSTTTGTASLSWTDSDGNLTASRDGGAVIFDGGSMTYDPNSAFSCSAEITDGVLDIHASGALPGEACVLVGLNLLNGSSLSVTDLALDYGDTDYGANGSGDPVEAYLVTGMFASTGDPLTPLSFPSSVAAGELARGDGPAWGLVIEVPATTPADGAVYDATGIAATGVIER